MFDEGEGYKYKSSAWSWGKTGVWGCNTTLWEDGIPRVSLGASKAETCGACKWSAESVSVCVVRICKSG